MSELIMSSNKLPDITNWSKTRVALRSASHLIKHIQVKFIESKSMQLEHGISINKNGVYTDNLGDLGRLFFNFRSGEIYLENYSKEKVFSIDIKGKNISSLTSEIKSKFKDLGKDIILDSDELKGTESFEFPSDDSNRAADILWYFYSALARFRSKLFGAMSPVVMWTHHFDFAFVFFTSPEKRTEQDSHMCFGFAPTLDESYKNPYAYFYAWDGPKKEYVKVEEDLPENVSWNKTFTVLKYDDVKKDEHPAEFFEDHFMKLFDLHVSKLS